MASWDLPDLTPVGARSMSSADGGGGQVSCRSTSATLEEVVALLTAELGAPAESTPTGARWRSEVAQGLSRSITSTAVWLVGHGHAPGFDPSLVPAGAVCVVEEGSLFVPGR